MKEEINPWETISSKEIYDNPWINLTEHQVKNPSGGPGIYGVIHFKHLAIGAVPYENGYIWLVGQYRYPLERYSWEIPEGGGVFGEDPEETAKRELKEETGLSAETYEIIVEMDLSNSVSDERAIVFLAKGISEGIAAPEETEDLQVKKVKLEEAFEMMEKGIIRDSLTVTCLLKLMLMKERGTLEG